ncbi:MAG: cupin-like domain-containing protein [Betaproteobacteria bacterium]|nr:cupin-like domain-containing protein [Betaproteobacteria bacterium]
MISVDRAEFREKFGRLPFSLSHRLHESPLFALERLNAEAAKAAMIAKARKGPKFVNKSGLSKVDAKFADAAERAQVVNAVSELKDSGAWMKISNICAVNAEYRVLLDTMLREIERVAEVPLIDNIVWSQMTVFMASPNVVTPYHIDHEQNFLFQITGDKEISLFPPDDRELLPDTEIERFYTGDINAARYREALQPRGTVFKLRPGVAVHLPSLGAHWVRNGADVSISVSINFCTRETDRRAHVYQMNHYLRKLGLKPRPPGKSIMVDTLKAGYLDLLSKHPAKSYDDAVYSGIYRQRALLAPLRHFRKETS